MKNALQDVYIHDFHATWKTYWNKATWQNTLELKSEKQNIFWVTAEISTIPPNITTFVRFIQIL